jgi:hypothetical protein
MPFNFPEKSRFLVRPLQYEILIAGDCFPGLKMSPFESTSLKEVFLINVGEL